MRWIGGIGTALLSVWSQSPSLIQQCVWGAVILFFADMATGLWRAKLEKRWRSRRLIEGAVTKIVQFSGLFAAFAAVSVVVHNVHLMLGWFSIILSYEFMSIIENVYAMERYGVRMPPFARDLINRVGKYLALAGELSVVETSTENRGSQRMPQSVDSEENRT